MTDAKSTNIGAGKWDFDWAIAPLPPQDFFRDYYEKSHLVIRREEADYYDSLLNLADIDSAVTSLGLRVNELNMVRDGTGVPAADFAYANGAVDPVRVFAEVASGATLILQGLHRRLPQLAAYCRSLEAEFSANLQTNIYMTPAGAQGFKTHYDTHDVIVLQAFGSKEWRIYDTPTELPMRQQSFDPEGFEPGPVRDTFTLGPGDMAYIPRGLVHDARSTDEMSLHITTGVLARSWTDLFLEAVAAHALKTPAMRQTLPPGYANDGYHGADVQDRFADLLAGFMAGAAPQEAMSNLAADFQSQRRPVVPGQLLQIAGVDALGPRSMVGARPALIYKLDAGPEGQITLACHGNDITFPADIEAALRFALSTPQFMITELPGGLDEDSKLVLIRRLIREGLALAL
ncbi:MAG: hypothetical protein JKX69_11245 [Rhodobacteraceae bacterium]|nr:hypothetical protein [Paracoccaceae bacterium]